MKHCNILTMYKEQFNFCGYSCLSFVVKIMDHNNEIDGLDHNVDYLVLGQLLVL